MQAIARFCVFGFALLTLAACGNSNRDTAKNETQTLVQEQVALAKSLFEAGMPRADWSDAQIKTYEKKLNRLEVVEKQLRARGSKVNNSGMIESRRAELKVAQETKKRELEPATADARARVQTLSEENKALNLKLLAKGNPSALSTQAELTDVIASATQILSNLDKQIALVSQNPSVFADSAKGLLFKLGDFKTQIEGLKMIAQRRLEQLSSANPAQ